MNLYLKFCSDLSFFLPKAKKNVRFCYPLERRANIKDIIEANGVPHTEVGDIRIHHTERVDFSFIPVAEMPVDISALKAPVDPTERDVLGREPIRQLRFIADVNVIKLGKLLLLLGFDVRYSSSYPDDRIADLAAEEKRIVLTRDTALLKRIRIVHARRLRSNFPYEQLNEVYNFFNLQPRINFFSRCTDCNIRLQAVEKDKIVHHLEPKTKKYFNTFFLCPECRKIFWKGSHYDHVKEKLAKAGIYFY